MPTSDCPNVTHSAPPLPSLSVIIPAYNEANRLPPTLRRIVGHLETRQAPYEILVVDDGSKDETAEVVERLADRHAQIRLLRSPVNMGKGAAVRHGMEAAQGDLQLFTDADGATPIEELERLEAAVSAGADLAIGSRALASRAAGFTVRAGWYRSALGSLFNALVQRLGIQGVSDTQCGFKLFRRAIARDLFSVSCVDGYAFDLELLYVAKRRGYRIAEVPVNWTDQPGSKVRPWRDGLVMIRELLGVRRRDMFGFYHRPYRPAPTRIEPALAPAEPSHF